MNNRPVKHLYDTMTPQWGLTDGKPLVTWSPDLNTNGAARMYTVMGKENLTDALWQSSTNSTHRFFKVKVGVP